MAQRIREITDKQCAQFEADANGLVSEVEKVIDRHAAMYYSEWLGGDIKADNSEEAPARCQKAISLLRQAVKLIQQADHEVAIFRAVGDEPLWMEKAQEEG